MRKTNRKLPLLFVVACCGLGSTAVEAQVLRADTSMRGPKVVIPVSRFSPDEHLRWDRTGQNRIQKHEGVGRPVRVNNAERLYFPPIFHQENASCTAASRIAYMFTYEMNAARRLDAKLEENQYPTHYNWLHYYQNTDYPSVLRDHGVPNAPTYGGRTYSTLFGPDQNWYSNDYGWMQGYDKWYSAMFNRIERAAMFPISVGSEEGREAVKQWLWNHQGDDSFDAGGVCVIAIGFTKGFGSAIVPDTETNRAIGASGEGYVKTWGSEIDHEMVIVGYDDRVEFDLDNNGVAGEAAKGEVGAWIIANSWGETWDGNGLIYCPYKTAVGIGTDGHGNPNAYLFGYWNPEVYYVKADYKPLRTMKVTLDFSKRSEIALMAGISADTSALVPERSVAMEYFKFGGNGMKLDDNIYPDAETPMLGRWADGKMHDEPMELGYDLTSLSEGYDLRKPVKYFFVIDSKKSAQGQGHIHSMSVLDYEFDPYGVESVADMKSGGVQIQNQGGRTVVSVIVGGEALNAPRNVMEQNMVLSWDKPAPSGYELLGYRLYDAVGKCVATPGKDDRQLNVSGLTGDGTGSVFSLVALYRMQGKEYESAGMPVSVRTKEPENQENEVRNMRQATFVVPDIMGRKYNNFTMEFWLKPTTLSDFNQQIGPGWGKFLFHSDASGRITAGWGINSRVSTATGVLKSGKWQHVAVVVDGNRLKIYVDGKECASLANNQQVGIGGFGDLIFGNNGNFMNGHMDELRIWSVARTAQQIAENMNASFVLPQYQSGLLAYYKMHLVKINDQTCLEDVVGGHHARLMEGFFASGENSGLVLNGGELLADFRLSPEPYFVGQEITAKAFNEPAAVQWKWQTAGAQTDNFSLPEAKLVFDEPGEQEIGLTVTDVSGRTSNITRKVQIQPMPKPDATFTASKTMLSATDRVVLTPVQDLSVNQYEWTIPGVLDKSVMQKQLSVALPKEGKYTVTLRVTNPQGSNTYSMEIEAMASAPKSMFAIKPEVIVKGEKVYLEDHSLYSPDTWQWELLHGNYRMLVNGQNSSVYMKETGIYEVSLSTSNEKGQDKLTKVNALTVCNADGQRGLRFYGDKAKVVFTSPFGAEGTDYFTIGWWMFPNTLQIKGNGIGGTENDFRMYSEANGSLHVHIGDAHIQSAAGFLQAGAWHHYAVSYENGRLTFYRDGSAVGEPYPVGVQRVRIDGDFTIGGQDAPFYGVIDEFQVWNKALSLDKLRQYANAPIIPDDASKPEYGEISGYISDAMKEGLVLYCSFNQNSGDVQDLTTNRNTGRRIDFGPDGDAWSNSKGIFWLNFNEPQAEDVSEQYLTNYKAPFLHNDTPFFVDQFMGYKSYFLESGTPQSGWILENETQAPVTTGFHVTDREYNYNMVVETGRGFAQELNNHKVYQTVELPAGFYQLAVDFGNYQNFLNTYLVVNKGVGIPDVENLDEALIYSNIASKSVAFQLDEPAELSLGFLVDWEASAWGCGTVSRITLSKVPFEVIDANGETTGLPDITECENRIRVDRVPGGVCISSDISQRVRIYTVSGACVFSEQVVGRRPVMLHSGIYIVNGIKVVVP